MKTGLVMEGGAMRGMFTAGVTDVLMENGIEFDVGIGVSAGACFGCNYKSGQNGRVIRYNLRFCRDKRYCSIQSLIKTGNMFGAEFCYHTIPINSTCSTIKHIMQILWNFFAYAQIFLRVNLFIKN